MPPGAGPQGNAADRFRAAVLAHDWAAVGAALDEGVAMYNPVSAEPLVGREAALANLRVLGDVFESFEHVGVLDEPAGSAPGGATRQAVLFRASVGGEVIEGVDLLEVGPDDTIVSFTVLARPMMSLRALGEAMGQRRP